MKRKFIFQMLTIIGILNTQVAIAQTQLPDSIISKIKSAPKKDLISVMGEFIVSSQVIKTDNLTFHNNAQLIFTDYTLPYVVIITKNLAFNAPAVKSTVRFGSYDNAQLKGNKGAQGANGRNAGGSGERGSNGSNGGTGSAGKTQHTPDIYLIVGDINTDQGEISSFDWRVFSDGLEGGKGGEGGNGGNGGRGSSGRNSRSGTFDCRRGATDGGRGGDGGKGGKGGTGGVGGNAGDIYLVGSPEVTRKLTYVQYSLNGGNGGDGGDPGNSGSGGSGGSGGNGSTFCHGADRGARGGKPASLGIGVAGVDGQNGEVKIINLLINDLYD